jgi:NCS1 family nucleobase:cation symporter-1
MIFRERSWAQIEAAEALAPFDGTRLNFMIAVELNVAAGLGWWPVMGNLSRLTKSARAATWPNLLGIGAAAALGETVGLIAALTLGSDDPTVWSIPIAGSAFGAGILIFIALANITSIVAFVYSSALAARQAGGALFARMPFPYLAALVLLPGAIGVFFPDQIYDNFFRFLAWTALAFAPLAGVALIDYLLRRGVIDVRSLYSAPGEGIYGYWRGINIAAMLALLIGAIVYVMLLNPLTLEAHGPFAFITASIPSCIAAGGVYALLMLGLRPKGQGSFSGPSPSPTVARREKDHG